MVGRCISYWNSSIVGDMLVFRAVNPLFMMAKVSPFLPQQPHKFSEGKVFCENSKWQLNSKQNNLSPDKHQKIIIKRTQFICFKTTQSLNYGPPTPKIQVQLPHVWPMFPPKISFKHDERSKSRPKSWILQVATFATPGNSSNPMGGLDVDWVIKSGQIIATSHDLTPHGGLVREIREI